MGPLPFYASIVLVTGLIAAATTPLFAMAARRIGLVVRPRDDRWHRSPTPLLGGAAMALAALTVLALVAPRTNTTIAIGVAAAAAFGLGLLDDFRQLAPSTKLVGQVLIASGLAYAGVRGDLGGPPPVTFVLTVFWIVAVMNAVNLMDNMDGLAAGVGAIAAIALGFTSPVFDPAVVIISAVTAGAALGFLVHNFYPARVFMGDAGSLLLGLLLGATALQHTAGAAANLGLEVVGALAVLALPIFDTALVAAARRLAGRPIGHGGRDHTSHRLAALGLSDRSTVLVLYGVAAALALLGILAQSLAGLLPVLIGLSVVALVLFGVFLHEVDVYGNTSTAHAMPDLFHKLFVYVRFGAEVGLDVVLVTIAYYSAYLLRFEGQPENVWIDLFIRSVPIVVAVQLAALVLTGVYRTLWRYLGLTDVGRIVRGVTVGTAAAALIMLLGFRFEGYSRAVFVLDWLFLSVLIIGSRSFLLSLRHWFSAREMLGDRRVLVVGATESGVLALRLLARSGSGKDRYRAIGFLDDDPGKRYRRVVGVPVVGTTADLDGVIERLSVDLVVVALEGAGPDAVTRIHGICATLGVECRDLLVPV